MKATSCSILTWTMTGGSGEKGSGEGGIIIRAKPKYRQ